MECSDKFDLDQNIKGWENELISSPAFTNADIEELKSHLLDLYYDLLKQNLSQEEAFLVAITRLGKSIDWSSEFEQANKHIFDLKKAILIVAGIFYYFFSYYAIRVILVAVLLGNVLLGNESIDAVKNVKYLILFILLIVFGNLIFVLINKGSFIINKLSRFKFSAKKITTTFLITVGLAIVNHSSLPFLHQLIPENWLRAEYVNTISYFNYAYPFLILLGMLFIYKKFVKIAEAPQN